MATTPALRFLRQKGVPHDVREYDHRVKGAAYAAQALDWPVAAMAKTLVAALSDRTHCLCVLPGDVELSLKKLARSAGVKAARMAGPGDAEKLTGYLVGGISPFGVRKRMPVWFHDTLPELDRIGINGGRRGLIVFLSPGDAVRAVDARVADLSA